jgi:hypothetical protein
MTKDIPPPYTLAPYEFPRDLNVAEQLLNVLLDIWLLLLLTMVPPEITLLLPPNA